MEKGDIVRIKDYKDIGNPNDWPQVVPGMKRYCGGYYGIEDIITEEVRNLKIYVINGWHWRESWLYTTNMDLKINDIVKITNTGSLYASYEDKAKELGATSWVKHRRFPKGIKKAKVLNIDNTRNIVLIETLTHNQQFIIGINGIKFDQASSILSEDLFEI